MNLTEHDISALHAFDNARTEGPELVDADLCPYCDSVVTEDDIECGDAHFIDCDWVHYRCETDNE